MATKQTYGIYVRSTKTFEDALEALREALGANGFGVLWEIDVQATMKKKLGVEFPPYMILGACNAPVAHQALSAEPNIGLLLPCNVIVRKDGDGILLGAISPHALMGLTGREGLEPFADHVASVLEKVLEAAR
ncbi:MAG: DUF302 domain-containing protein [Acidobacteriota bacterium]